jgi:hypothetical protein
MCPSPHGEEIREFCELAESFADDEVLGLARIAQAALVDQNPTLHGRQDAIRYLALNASTLLEDLWADDDSLWLRVPTRQIEFEDMLAHRETVLRHNDSRYSKRRISRAVAKTKSVHLRSMFGLFCSPDGRDIWQFARGASGGSSTGQA